MTMHNTESKLGGRYNLIVSSTKETLKQATFTDLNCQIKLEKG